MVKFLIPSAVAILIIGVLSYRHFLAPKIIKNQPSIQTATEAGVQTADGGRFKSLEEKVQKLGEITQVAQSTTIYDLVKNLEKAVEDLKSRVSKLEQTPPPPQPPQQPQATQSPTNKAPLYIPLGSSGATQALDWTSISSNEVVIDPADYATYSNMYLELSLRAFQGNGKAHARLFNKTDGTALISSEVSTSNQDYTLLTSSGFKLPSGKKTYILQLKSLTGYEATAQFARIKVTF